MFVGILVGSNAGRDLAAFCGHGHDIGVLAGEVRAGCEAALPGLVENNNESSQVGLIEH
jgi:hypothetical protein